MRYTYRAYGLTIRVPFACPALAPVGAGRATGPADVVVREGTVPLRLRSPRSGEASWDAAPGLFLLRGGRQAGRFLVGAGTVTFERNPGCDDATLARCFTDQVLPAVLRNRGLLVLHANAVAAPGGVIVIGGESGAGKSTALAALLHHGCRMLSDDVTALRHGRPGTVEVIPGVAQTHLTKEAAEGLGYPVDPAQLQPWRRMKAAIPTHGGMASRPGPLRALYVLRRSGGGGEVSVTALNGTGKFRVLQECMYGPMFAEEHPALFPLLATAVTTVPFFRLERPAARWSVSEVADAILGGVGEPAS